MFRRLWVVGALLVALVGSSTSATAQSSLTKVELKSGETLEGTLLDDLPNGGVKLILLDGRTREIAGSEVASITRPGALPSQGSADPGAAPTDTHPHDLQLGEAGESCRARSDCADGLKCLEHVCRDAFEGARCESRRDCGTTLGCFRNVCSTAEKASESAAASFRSDEDEVVPVSRPRDDIDGWYGGALAGGAVAPAFPGVAGVGGGTGFFGWRSGMFDLRVGFGGFGAAFPYGSMGVATARPELFLFVAGPYGFGVGMGPCVGYYEDRFIDGVISGGLATATPVALRFEVGSAFLEPSLSAGAIFGTVEQRTEVLARPFALLGFAAYSR
ncbi:MAG: hypothetical protein HOV80_07965 [Polyangiaceae bacterium]|nr:hypothetical protein [Polyangiaceae bacterium]